MATAPKYGKTRRAAAVLADNASITQQNAAAPIQLRVVETVQVASSGGPLK
jgi:hypothetical protein